jgi:hypothetical protein
MKNHKGYWITLALFAAVYTFSAIMDLTGVGPAKATMAHLGYPEYVAKILGVWKAGAVLALLAPGLARLKEWAYAGIVFDLSGGFISHIAVADPLPKPAIPVILLGLALTSYLLRPASRRLEEPAAERGERASEAVAARA